MTMHPAASSPCTWKTDLEMSSPIMLAFIWTVLSAGVTSKRQLGTFDAVRGPSTQHCERSEAIQPFQRSKTGLLRRFAPRNDGEVANRSNLIPLVHNDARVELHAAVEVDNVVIDQTDAAERHVGADGPRRIGAVDARLAVVERDETRAERIPGPAGQNARSDELAAGHLRRHLPSWPFGHAGDVPQPDQGRALRADADARSEEHT